MVMIIGSLDALTKMVMVSAIYFKGTWLNQFKPSRTKNLPFYLGSLRSAVPAKLMRSNGYYRTANLNEIHARALELPYSVKKNKHAFSSIYKKHPKVLKLKQGPFF